MRLSPMIAQKGRTSLFQGEKIWSFPDKRGKGEKERAHRVWNWLGKCALSTWR